LNILAIDTSTELFSVGISTCAGDFCIDADAGTSQSELLLDALDALTRLASIEREEIDIFTCMRGPGSFTGLRIGFAAVKGLALSLGKRMISVPTLDCAAHSFARGNFLCVPVLDARQKRFFSALYRGGKRLGDFMDCTAEELSQHIKKNLDNEPAAPRVTLFCGGGAALAFDTLSGLLPDVCVLADEARRGGASALLQYVKKSCMLNNMEDARFSAPLYIRKSDAEIKREAGGN
jgi:tRNA threonylcarbamoyladenosine biosynthesis protein TsaB